MIAALRSAALLLLVTSVLTGGFYPLAVTGIAALAFPDRASGSLVLRDGKSVGSRLLGQDFRGPEWFHGRPSATPRLPYDALLSGGSNLGPTNPALADRVRAEVERLRAENPASARIPVDLVTASASGLDPHISPAAALWQLPRVAAARRLDPARVRALVLDAVEGPDFGILGEPRVNVLLLNLALDSVAGH